MPGWLKLVEAIRQSEPPANESPRLLTNSQSNNSASSRREHSCSYSTNTNGRLPDVLEADIPTITLDSPLTIFNTPTIISPTSSSTQNFQDFPFIDIEPISKSGLDNELDMTSTNSSTPSPASTGVTLLTHWERVSVCFLFSI